MTVTINGTTGIVAPGTETFGDGTALGGATNPIVSMAKGDNNYVQGYIVNNTNGVNSSADLVCYPSNGTDSSGWVDMGVTGPTFSQAAYSVTGPNEAYLFGSAPSGASKTGNLVIATDSTGTQNAIQFYTGGFNKAKSAFAGMFDSSGNFGLGVTPSAWSTVKAIQNGNSYFGNINGGNAYFGNNAYYNGSNWIWASGSGSATAAMLEVVGNTFNFKNAASGTAGNAISFTQAMTLDASGNLGVGTTSPSTYGKFVAYSSGGYASIDGNGFVNSVQLLDTASAGGRFSGYSSRGLLGAIKIEQTTTGADGGYMGFGTCASGSTTYTERARIDSSGNLLVGKTSASASASIGTELRPTGRIVSTMSSSANTDDSYELYSTGAGAYRFYVGMGGTIYATNTSISAISDIRFKENVRDLNVGLAEILTLKPRLYDWKEGKGANIKNARGFIAQEFEEVFPDLIDEWKDEAPEGEEPYKSVRQDLIPVLVKAIQEQQAMIASQSAIITQLQADVAALKGNA